MTKSELESLSTLSLHRGVQACLSSIVQHQEAAGLLFSQGHHGFAMSHLVLASEEAVKGCVLWVRITGIELPEDSHRVFDAHWYKHEVGDGLSLVVVKAIRGVARAFDDNRMKALGASEDQVRIKRESDLAMKRMTGARIKQWWLEANELRNSGFYVDHKNGKWGRSERVQRKRFEDAFALVGALLAFLQVQVMMNRFSSKEIRRLD